MLPVEHIIFDLDDTLCDYSGARVRALGACYDLLPEGVDRTVYIRKYYEQEPILFQKFVQGKLSKEEYRVRRFLDPMGESDVSLACQMNDLYMKKANGTVTLFPGVMALLKELKDRAIRVSLLTNGPSDGQHKKIEALGIGAFFDRIYISEEIGWAKPDPQAFLTVIEGLEIPLERTLMVGDSLERDIQPARALGMQILHITNCMCVSKLLTNLL